MLHPSHLLLAAFSLAVAAQAADAQPHPRPFRIRSATAPGLCLDIRNDGVNNNVPIVTDCANATGQHWRWHNRHDGYVGMTTDWRGRGMCLDIRNDGRSNNRPMLAPCANVQSQNWKAVEDGRYVRLTTEWRGDNMCLGILRAGRTDETILTRCRRRMAQRWYFEDL